MCGKMSKAPNTAAIDFGSWNMDPNPITKMFSDAAATMIRDVLEEQPPEISLPYEWAPKNDGRFGPTPEDPLTLYVRLPFGAWEDDHVEWQYSLRGVVEEVIGVHMSVDGMVRDEPGVKVLTDIETALRELADHIGRKLAPLDTTPRPK